MSKYSALGDYLRRQRGSLIPMTFGEIEKITGTKLPASSRYRAWWSNNDFNSVLTKVWIDAGFKSEQVDMTARKLVFRRVPTAETAPVGSRAVDEKPFHPLYGMMRGMIRVMPGTDLTQPADSDWADELDRLFGSAKRKR